MAKTSLKYGSSAKRAEEQLGPGRRTKVEKQTLPEPGESGVSNRGLDNDYDVITRKGLVNGD